MDDCCGDKGQEIEALALGSRRRVLQVVLAINVAMFGLELGAGIVARSTALIADSVDMLGDAFVYALSLYALSRGDRWKAGAALVKSGLMLLFAVGITADIVAKLSTGVTPTSSVMAIAATGALIANASCLGLLWRHRSDDVNMSSTFECSRNDVVANAAVLVAAAGVWLTGRGWPDIAVGALVVVVFVRSAVNVFRDAWPRLNALTEGETS